MNQTIIVILSIVGFIVISSVSVFIYFQNQSITSTKHIECFFATDSLLNYLENPQCDRPQGVFVLENYQCVAAFSKSGYERVECKDPNKAWVENDCLRIRINETTTLSQCP